MSDERRNEDSGAREQREQCGVSERVSVASEQVNERASGPVLTSRFMAVLNQSGAALETDGVKRDGMKEAA